MTTVISSPRPGKRVTALYAKQVREIPFHGLHHVNFVVANAKKFAHELDADAAKVEIAALVHDVNYLVAARSGVAAGQQLRYEILRQAGLDEDSAAEIEEIVATAETNVRNRYISAEAMALVTLIPCSRRFRLRPLRSRPCTCVRPAYRFAISQRRSSMSKSRSATMASTSTPRPRKRKYNCALGECQPHAVVMHPGIPDDPSVADVIEQVAKYTKIPLETPYGDGREPEASYSAAEPVGGTIAETWPTAGRCPPASLTVHLSWQAPGAVNIIGASAVGSSDACMLASLAAKWRWRAKRRAEGSRATANMVCGPVQAVWHEFAKYWDIEMREVPQNRMGRLTP